MKHTSLFTKLIAAFFFVALLIVVVSSKKDAHRPTTLATPSASQQAHNAAMTPEQKVQEEKNRREKTAKEEERRLQKQGLRWNYEESSDQMGRGLIRNAMLESINEIEFGFPYQGSQRGSLQLRIHPKYGKNVILSIHRGQFLCRLDGCVVEVRFDEGKAQTYSASEAADHRTTSLFLSNYERFLNGLRRSKMVYIEAQFYQEASRVFKFDTRGLKW